MKENITETPSKSRNHFLDFTKAIAIILVVLGHCIQYGSGGHYLKEALFYDNNLFKFIYCFHMPLFMIISGYLFSFGINRESSKLLIGKFKSLIVPIFSWSIILYLYIIFANILNDNFSIVETIKSYFLYCIYSLWFLWAVFYCSLIVILINRYFKDSIIIYTVVFIISFIIPDSYNLHLYKFMYPFFIIGYFYNKYYHKLERIFMNKYIVFIIGAVFLFMLCFFERESYIYVSRHTLLNKDFVNQLLCDLYRYTIGIIGSIVMLLILYKVYNFMINHRLINDNSFILTVGKNTMGIYIISSFINIYVLNRITNEMNGPNFLIITIESIFIIFISILVISLIRKFSILNKYLLGAK